MLVRADETPDLIPRASGVSSRFGPPLCLQAARGAASKITIRITIRIKIRMMNLTNNKIDSGACF